MSEMKRNETSTNKELFMSIIMPVHNRKEMLDEVLSNIYNNLDYKNFEVIIFDDASTEDLNGVLNKFPCKVIRNEIVSGPAVGRNTAAKLANGEILFFTDSDVILNSDTLQIASNKIAQDGYDGVTGILDPEVRFKNFASNYKNLYLHYMLIIQPESTFFFHGSLSAIKKDSFFDVGGFDENFTMPCIEDLELGNRLARRYKLYLSKEMIGEHIKHYSITGCLSNGFQRSNTIVKLYMREIFRKKEKASKYNKLKQTPPKSFIYGLGLLALALLCLIPGFFFHHIFYLFSIGLLTSIFLLNLKFLLFLMKKKGKLFFIKSFFFMYIDMFFMGLGVFKGIIEFITGKKY